MRKFVIISWVAGLAVLIVLLARYGTTDIIIAVGKVGWGLPVISAFYLVPLVADTRCWQLLLPRAKRPKLIAMVVPRWICSSINGLLPVAQVGGDVVRARLMMLRAVPGPIAGASIVADITVGIATQILFALLGLLILLQHDDGGATTLVVAVGVGLFTLLLLAFLGTQHLSMFGHMARVFERVIRIGDWTGVLGSAQELDREIKAVYARRADLLLAGIWRLLGWVAGAGEVWLALWFLGHPVSLLDAFMLESMGQAVRAAAFLVPGALGVQEGAFILLASTVGLTPETGLALSLVKRVRELLVGIPALLVWQIIEGRRLLDRPSDKQQEEQQQGRSSSR